MAATIYSIFLLVLSVLAHWTPILVAGDEASDCAAELATLTTALSNADAAVTAANNALATAQQAKVTAQQAVDAKTTICSFTCPAGFTKVTGVQKCIRLVNEYLSWDAALARCAVLQPGSYLVSIDSPAELTFVQSRIAAFNTANGITTRGYWTGGRRLTDACTSDMVYKTVAGGPTHPLSFTDLFGGIAFSCNTGTYVNEFCMEIIKDSYKMNDIPCTTTNRPICQYP
jgi:hypothetical protein